MSAYVYPDFKTKVAVKRALVAGEKIQVMENTPWGREPIENSDRVFLEGPHYPEPHKWYGQGVVKDGYLTYIK